MPDRCKICTNEITEATLRDHIVRNHDEHGRSVETAYPAVYEKLFDGDAVLDEAVSPQEGDGTPHQSSNGSDETIRHTDTEEKQIPSQQNEDDKTRTCGTQTTGTDHTTTSDSSPETRTERTQSQNSKSELVEQSRSPQSERSDSIDRGPAKRWAIIGVGGAGNHLLDTILMRRDALREQGDPLADLWENAVADYLNINTNRSEVYGTYYAQMDKEYTAESLISNCMIGYNQHAYSGAGRDWEFGRDLMQHDFSGEQNPVVERWDIDRQSVRGAQAIMLIHSVSKGTGCGAAPVLAENLREMIDSLGPSNHTTGVKPILSSVIIPRENRFKQGEMARGVLGIARLSKAVDGILLFDNEQLERMRGDLAVELNKQAVDQYTPLEYQSINRLFVSFLEKFTMPSMSVSTDSSSTYTSSSELIDVPDSIRPVIPKYPVSDEREFNPAVVMVPAIGRHDGPSNRDELDTLVRLTLLQGQCVEFEPGTAWGGTFITYGPEEKMNALSPLLRDGQLHSIIGDSDFLDVESSDTGKPIDIYINQIVIPHVDSVHLCGIIWNPHLPTLERMHTHAESLMSNSNSRQAKALEDIQESVESIFGYLGRENMG